MPLSCREGPCLWGTKRSEGEVTIQPHGRGLARVRGHHGEAQVVPGSVLSQSQVTHAQTAWSCDPWNPQPVRETEIGWEAGLRKGHGAVREMEKVMSLMNNVAQGMNCNLLDPKAQMGKRLPEAQGCVMMACHRPGGRGGAQLRGQKGITP